MSYHRFNQLIGSLKSTTQMESFLPQGLKGVIKSAPTVSASAEVRTYTPKPTPDFTSDSTPDKPNKWNPHGWKSWRDIPDSMIPTTSTRDPDNKIYATRKYIDLRKQQIWYQIPDGKPVWLKDWPKDYIYYYGIIVSQIVMGVWIAYEMYQIVFRGTKG